MDFKIKISEALIVAVLSYGGVYGFAYQNGVKHAEKQQQTPNIGITCAPPVADKTKS